MPDCQCRQCLAQPMVDHFSKGPASACYCFTSSPEFVLAALLLGVMLLLLGLAISDGCCCAGMLPATKEQQALPSAMRACVLQDANKHTSGITRLGGYLIQSMVPLWVERS